VDGSRPLVIGPLDVETGFASIELSLRATSAREGEILASVREDFFNLATEKVDSVLGREGRAGLPRVGSYPLSFRLIGPDTTFIQFVSRGYAITDIIFGAREILAGLADPRALALKLAATIVLLGADLVASAGAFILEVRDFSCGGQITRLVSSGKREVLYNGPPGCLSNVRLRLGS
jgi:hypothetical protein